MSEIGVIKQIIGAVIDVEFDKDQIPNIYDALVVSDNNLVWKHNNNLVMVLLELWRWARLKDLNEALK